MKRSTIIMMVVVYGLIPFVIALVVEHYTGWGTVVCILLGYLGVFAGGLIWVSLVALCWSIGMYFYREVCGNCGEKRMRAGRMCSEDSEAPDGNVRFMLSQCDGCSFQMRRYQGEMKEVEMVAPDSNKYWNLRVSRRKT